MDEPGAVRLFLDHAAGLGHRSFALIDGPPTVDTVHRRATAARRICAAQAHDLTVRHAAPSEDGGWDAATKMLRRGPRPTVCGVGHLTQLFGVMAALRDAGVEVPGDMSVVSFDEDQCLAFLEVPVSSVCMPLPELGAAAVDALIARIEGGPAGRRDGPRADEPARARLGGPTARPGSLRAVRLLARIPRSWPGCACRRA